MTEAVEDRRPLRVAVLGVSGTRTCGVRDHAGLLSAALAAEGVQCEDHWLSHRGGGLGETRALFADWSSELHAQLRADPPDAVLAHYSVFSYGYRGIPLFTRSALAPARAASLPIVSLLHEYAYPWGRGGLRGAVWAASQRVALLGVIRASAAVVVTAPVRARWLSSRRWLPRRDVSVAPVFSNLPAPSEEARAAHRDGRLVGLFGYAYEGAEMNLVLDALRIVAEREQGLRLALLGAPGPGTPAAQAWLQAAQVRGIGQLLSFSGVLSAQELADALARCDVLLHPEPSGPTSRKGTLAGSLAAGRPVVALDGPRAWEELLENDAALVVAPSAGALAEGVDGLLRDRGRADSLGARGGAFADLQMGVARSARVVRAALERVVEEPAAKTPPIYSRHA